MEFNQSALELIDDFVTEYIEKLKDAVPHNVISLLKFQLTNNIKFRCIKQARKEKKEVIEREIVEKILNKLRKKLISLKPEERIRLTKIYYDNYRRLKERIRLTEIRRLLDLGCGWGRVIGFLLT